MIKADLRVRVEDAETYATCPQSMFHLVQNDLHGFQQAQKTPQPSSYRTLLSFDTMDLPPPWRGNEHDVASFDSGGTKSHD